MNEPNAASSEGKADGKNSSKFASLMKQALIEVNAQTLKKASARTLEPAFEPAVRLLESDFPSTPWLARGILVEKAVATVAGEPKTAKTWAALEMAMAVATGTDAFRAFPTGQPRHVAVFLVEDAGRSVRNRLRALSKGRGLDVSVAVGNIYVKCRGRLDLLNPNDLAWVIASCRALPKLPELLVLDPLRDLHGARENESDEMAPVMHSLRLLRDLIGCAVLFVHHASKSNEATNTRRPGQRMRGSSSIHASVDGGLYLSGLNTDGSSWFESTADVELKAVRGAGQFSVRLDVVDDDAGEAVEARWTVSRREAADSKGDNLEQVQTACLKLLKEESTTASIRGEPPKPFAVETLKQKLRKRKETVTAALYQLMAEGKAEQVFAGRKVIGWRFVDPVRSGSVPEASERSDEVRSPPFRGNGPFNGNASDDYCGNEARHVGATP